MRKLTLMWLCLILAAPAFAQDESPAPEGAEESAPESAEAEASDEAEPDAEAEPSAEVEAEPEAQPEAEPQLEIDPEALELQVEPDEEEEDDAEVTDDAVDLLAESEPPSSDPTVALPTTPQPIFGLHGYFRTRGEVYDNFFLGRDGVPNPTTGLRDLRAEPGAFQYFRPADRGLEPAGGCGEGTGSVCGTDRLSFANMRLRLAPTISLSDDVQVHMMIDAFDNLVLGSTPEGSVYLPVGAAGGSAGQFTNPARSPGVPIDSFAATQNPSQALRNGGRDSIYVRRAWASVRNRDLGQLRFGRMGSHWGLGMLANGGEGIDADFSSDVDRVMAVTKLFGIYAIAAYDFASQGQTNQLTGDLRGVPFDLTGQDDVRQYVFALARREEERTAAERLSSGSWVLEGGLYYVFRSQFLSSAGTTDPFATNPTFVRRDARAHIPDLWARFRMGGLRLELEAAAIIGEIGNIENDTFTDDPYRLLQFGLAFEGEYRMLDDKLSIRLYTGYATGDADVNGLSSRDGLLAQQSDNRTVSAFNFHPNYRVDLILWRNIMERVSGAWYLRPGVSYDLIKSPFGRLFGASVDFVYSRAAQEVQTYGSNPNLGFEIDLSLYYRSEDGPEIFDGFYGMFQYGVLFPLAGLGYSPSVANAPDISTAQSLRLVLGVQY
ncbi:MAG: TIGR04551 family protein [Polyangiales bacterium]